MNIFVILHQQRLSITLLREFCNLFVPVNMMLMKLPRTYFAVLSSDSLERLLALLAGQQILLVLQKIVSQIDVKPNLRLVVDIPSSFH
jgi:hypothetical protein